MYIRSKIDLIGKYFQFILIKKCKHCQLCVLGKYSYYIIIC